MEIHGYFEIEIDPEDTEVCVEYVINLSFVKQPSTISSDMVFEYYSLNGENVKHSLSNNTIDGTTNDKVILLNGKSCLDENDIQTYKIYWRWVGSDLEVNPQTCTINANVEVRQIV